MSDGTTSSKVGSHLTFTSFDRPPPPFIKIRARVFSDNTILLSVHNLVLFSITESAYENDHEKSRFKHKHWVVPSKCNIALVTDTKSNEKVVLKLIKKKPEFSHELLFLQDLKTTNARKFVVKLKDYFEPSEGSSELRYCIVLERLGDNLHDYLRSNRDLDEPTCVALALNLVKAVEALHREGVIHGDLKPHQVCFTRQPGIALKLVDFDSARRMQLPVAPLDRLTPMYAAPEVVRADAEGKLPTFAPTRGVDSWPLGLMLAQIFHPDMDPVFSDDAEAQEILLGDDPLATVNKRVKNSREGIWRAVEGLLQMNPRERWSASQVLRERIFTAGAFTIVSQLHQGQETLLAGQAKLQKSVEATQNLIVEYGDTPVPRMAILVPDDLANNGQSTFKGVFSRLASNADLVKYYNLYFVCEGCTLFPSTECSCRKGLSEPVCVSVPGDTLKTLVPALKAAMVLFMTASIASSVAGVRLPVELPGVSDLAEFVEAVNEFVEAAGNTSAAPRRAAADDDQEEEAEALALANRTKAYGPTYAALEDLLARSGVAVKDNTCQGLLKVFDKDDCKVYWVCETHAEALRDSLLNASIRNNNLEAGIFPPAVPEEAAAEADVTAMSSTDVAASLESTKRKVDAQEILISELWTKRKFAAAAREVSQIVKAHDAFARASEDFARLTAKAAALATEEAANGFKSKAKLSDKKSTDVCQGGCGVKLNWGYLPSPAKAKRCKVCGHAVCAACSPPPKLEVEGYSKPQRVCKECVEAPTRAVQERVKAAEEAAVQSAIACEKAKRAKEDQEGTATLPDVSGASLFLEGALSVAAAEKEFDRAAVLKHKLKGVCELDLRRKEMQSELDKAYDARNLARWNEITEALKALPAVTLSVAIAMDAFPVDTVVCASVAGGGVVAGTAGKVVGHTSTGQVVVRFQEGEGTFEVATLSKAGLPNGWAIKDTCYFIDEVFGEASNGKSGLVMGWSAPFDRNKILAYCNGREVNVLPSQIETEPQFKVRGKLCILNISNPARLYCFYFFARCTSYFLPHFCITGSRG